MSGLAKDSSPSPGPKRRSTGQAGGLFGRMFGSSGNGNGKNTTPEINTTNNNDAQEDGGPLSPTISAPQFATGEDGEFKSPSRTMSEDVNGGPKRRSSGVEKARGLFSSAKQSLSNLGGSSSEKVNAPPVSPMQKLGKADPALSVPQGSFNNSAGESTPTPRSTFRVGVTEDKNKKCRRTMEDTHAYLYNFLSTPAPALADGGSKGSLSLSPSTSRDSNVNASNRDISPKASLGEREVVETDNGYFAIFDGHAGTFAADWCGKKVHILLEEIIRKNPNSPIPELLDQTFTSVDQQLEKLPLKNSGCTAVIAVLRWEDRVPNSTSATGSTAIAAAVAKEASETSAPAPFGGADPAVEDKLRQNASRQRVLYTANVGDARIVLCRNGKALRLSYDHKGSDENEGKRIAGAGGLILNNRVNGVLAVTRALGDAYMKDLVTGHPYTTETVIQPEIDEFLILACDGLWDVCSDQEAVDLVRNIHDPQAASKALVDHALARFSTDNLSCMLVRFDNKALQQNSSVPEKLIGVDGDPTSRTGGISEADAILHTSQTAAAAEGSQAALARATTEEFLHEVREEQEPGPELNVAALEAARKK